jgi:hypothetical protein
LRDMWEDNIEICGRIILRDMREDNIERYVGG